MTLPLPPFLKSGDCIGIAATARWVSREQLQPALDLFTGWGLRVKVADQVYTRNFQLAGSPDVRCSGLQEMLDDPEVNAVIIARGGYGTVHVSMNSDSMRCCKNQSGLRDTATLPYCMLI